MLWCQGVRVPRMLDYPTINLTAVTCTVWSQCTPVPDRRRDKQKDKHHGNSVTICSAVINREWKKTTGILRSSRHSTLSTIDSTWNGDDQKLESISPWVYIVHLWFVQKFSSQREVKQVEGICYGLEGARLQAPLLAVFMRCTTSAMIVRERLSL